MALITPIYRPTACRSSLKNIPLHAQLIMTVYGLSCMRCTMCLLVK